MTVSVIKAHEMLPKRSGYGKIVQGFPRRKTLLRCGPAGMC